MEQHAGVVVRIYRSLAQRQEWFWARLRGNEDTKESPGE